jgi:asparagine synthase (glutamine-hydrolysing)
MNEPIAVKIIGYCELDKQALLKKFMEQGPGSLRDLRGEYTLAIEAGNECFIITSPVGAIHYFYALKDGKFYHSDKVVDILKDAKLEWKWDWQALGDLCQLENLTENATLHKDIRKVPPGSILRFKDGKVGLESIQYLDTVGRRKGDPDEALAALNDEVAFWAGDNPYLSLSGGFDSRLILSSLLKQGIKPHLITVGNDECTDVEVTSKIAARFGLRHDIVALTLEDFIAYGPEIARITNGTKPACHWHTYLYPLKAAIPKESVFFVGTLGEFARSYYFDKGALSQAADIFGEYSLLRFWNRKLNRHRTFSDTELQGLAPEFSEQINSAGTAGRARRLVGLCHKKFLSGLARFYFEQRVPNFYANGIKMYQATSNWRSPYHSRKWISAVWSLDNSWKLGSNWHRYAIRKNFPQLLDFPEQRGFLKNKMLPKAPPFYWTPFMRRLPYVGYDLSSGWFRDAGIQEFMRENIRAISDIIDDKTALNIIEAHRKGIDRTRAIAFLLSLMHWELRGHTP